LQFDGSQPFSQSQFVTKTAFHYDPVTSGSLTTAFTLTDELTTTKSDSSVITQERLTDYMVQQGTSSGQSSYILAPKRTRTVANGTEVAREELFYDGATTLGDCGHYYSGYVCTGSVTKRRVYRSFPALEEEPGDFCQDESVCVEYGTVHSPSTGELARKVRPKAMKDASGCSVCANSYTAINQDSAFQEYVAQITNEVGHVVQYSYDLGTGSKLSELGPNIMFGYIREERDWSYDGLGRVIKEFAPQLDPNIGYYTTTLVRTYDYSREPLGLYTADKVQEYTALDWPSATQRWIHTSKYFDGHGRLILAFAPAQSGENEVERKIAEYTYTARGNLAAVSTPDPSNPSSLIALVTHSFEHDARDRIKTVTAPDASSVVVSYAPWEKTIREPPESGEDAKTNHQVYDGLGRLIRVDEGTAVSTIATTGYAYDGAGRIQTITDADGHQTTIVHDGQGNRKTITRAGNRQWQYTYDVNANLSVKIDPDQRRTEYTYDDIGRLLNEHVVDAKLPPGVSPQDLGIGDTDLSYDIGLNGMGRLTGVSLKAAGATDPYAKLVYSHDSLGYVSQESWTLSLTETGPRSFTVSRSYSPRGQELSTTYPNGQTVTRTYDNLQGRLYTVQAGSQTLAQFGYDVTGRLLIQTSPVSVEESRVYSYDSRGRLSTDAIAVGSLSMYRAYQYRFDNDIRQLTIQDALSDGLPGSTVMTFKTDALHRLVDARGGTGLPNYAAGLTYSPAGNVATATVLGAVSLPDRTAGTVPGPMGNNEDPLPPGLTYTYGTGSDADPQAVTALGAPDHKAEFAYDAAGNLTGRLTGSLPSGGQGAWPALEAHFVYDAEDRVRKASGGTGVERYFYDHTGTRFLVLNGSQWRLYFGPDFEIDHDSSGLEKQSIYVSGANSPIARLTDCTLNGSSTSCGSAAPPPTTLVHHDRRGDLLASFGGDGSVQSHFHYGAFGEILAKFEANAGEWRRTFNGKETDQIDGLSYYGFRYYDPLVLQWTSADPLYRFAPDIKLEEPQKMNLYAFELNNPVRSVDLDGRDTMIISGIPNPKDPPNMLLNTANLLAKKSPKGIPAAVVDARRGREAIAQKAAEIAKKGRSVTSVVFVGHGGGGKVAADSTEPGVAQTTVNDLASEAKVKKGGAVVVLGCGLTDGRKRISEIPDINAATKTKGLQVAGFDGYTGFADDSTGKTYFPSTNRNNPHDPGEMTPTVNTDDPSGAQTINEIIQGAEKRSRRYDPHDGTK
jgi:RHS repeat-associated protein